MRKGPAGREADASCGRCTSRSSRRWPHFLLTLPPSCAAVRGGQLADHGLDAADAGIQQAGEPVKATTISIDD